MTNITLRNALWPDVSQPEKAHYAVDQGFWVTLLMAGITSVMIIVSLIPAWNWITIVLLAIITIGLRLRMRSAAIAVLLIFIASTVASIPSQAQQIIITLLFLLVFINAVRGTFSLHTIKKGEKASLVDGKIIPPLRKIDFLAALFILVLFIFPFIVFQGVDRADFIKNIREAAGIAGSDSSFQIPNEPATMTMAGGSKITITSDWKIQQSQDAPKNSIFAELRSGNMWALFQEESKADIQRDLGTDYVGEMTLDTYAEAVRIVLTSDLTDVTFDPPSPVMIQGKQCLRFATEGVTQNVRLHFEPTVCDIGEAFLRASVWSPKSVFETQRSKAENLIMGIRW